MKDARNGGWIVGGIGIALLLTGWVSSLSYRNATTIMGSADQVQQTYEVLKNLTDFRAAMSIAESGRRGYIFLDDQRELVRYQQAMQVMQTELTELQQQLGGNLQQQEQGDRIFFLAQQRLALLQQSIALHQGAPDDLQTQLQMTETSIRLRAQIERSLFDLEAEEERLLQRSLAESRRTLHQRIWLEFLGIGLLLCAIFGTAVILYRQGKQHQQVEALEQRLLQERQLGELKLKLFSMVSHEFRTPLSVILASSQLLSEILQDSVERSKLNNLSRIQSSARLMNQMLTDILTLTRAEVGTLEFRPAAMDVEAFCLNLVEDLQSANASKSNIQFIRKGQCQKVRLDEKLLYSILSNLLMNAVKYSPKGETVTLRLICQSDALIFEIQDNGIGIPATDQQRIYEPFFRSTNIEEIPGTGLGLAVVKKCLELHNGTIDVCSSLETGTTFTVVIPASSDRK